MPEQGNANPQIVAMQPGMPGQGPGAPQGGSSFNLLGAIRKRPVKIILLAMVLAVLAVAAGYLFVAPQYVVRAQLILNPSTPAIMYPDVDLANAPGGRGYQSFQKTQFLQIRSREVLFEAMAVLRDLAENGAARQADLEVLRSKQRRNRNYTPSAEEEELLELAKMNLIGEVPADVFERLNYLFGKSAVPFGDKVLPASTKRFSVETVQADDRFEVVPIPRSYAFSLQYTIKGDPERNVEDRRVLEALPCFVNAVVYAYRKQYRQIIRGRVDNTLAVLDAELARFELERDEVRDELKKKTNEVDAETRGMTQNRYEALAVENQKSLHSFTQMIIQSEIDLEAARDNLARAEEDRKAIEAMRERAKKEAEDAPEGPASEEKPEGAPGEPAQARRQAQNPMIRERIETDERVQRLNRQLEEKRNLLAMLETQFTGKGRENPQIRMVKGQIAMLEARLSNLKDELTVEVAESIVEERKRMVERMENRLALLKTHRDRTIAEKEKNLEEAKTLYRNAEAQRVEIRDLEDSLQEIKATISSIRQRRRAIEIEQKAQPTLQIHSLARVPEQPSIDKRMQAMLGGAMLALVLAIGLGVLLDMRDQRVMTARDIETHVNAPTLGVVQRMNGRFGKDVDPRRACIDQAGSLGAEQYRAVASALLAPHEGSTIRTLMVTSPGKGDGKSTLTCNLGSALAQMGERVLVVDANMVNPDLTGSFDLPRPEGLSDAIAGRCALEEAIQPTELANLDILAAGGSRDEFDTNPLAHPSGAELLEEAVERYRFVIVDTPPILLTADASSIGARVDGVICAVRPGVRNRGEVRRAVERIRKTGTIFLGVVLNGARPMRGGYYQELDEDYHAYHRDKSKKRKAKDSAAS